MSRSAEVAPAATAIATSPVDVIVPVHGATEALRRCLDAVWRHAPPPHRLVLALDGSQDDDLEALLDTAAERGDAVILRGSERRGFAATVNRGLDASRPGADVVLLNSDTEVTPGWLSKLQRAATSRPRVATVTPLSNHATICSVPNPLVENLIPIGHDVDSFARLVERVAAPVYPEIPTGVGFCLYVRRAALEDVPRFDEAYGMGYGEEVDFCRTLSHLGFAHLADDATFVYHEGGASFGPAALGLRRRAGRRLARRHPGFRRDLARFLDDDPLAPIRDRIVRALAQEPKAGAPGPRAPQRRILHLVHGWPPRSNGGTETYARWLAREQSLRHDVTVFARSEHDHRPTASLLHQREGGIDVRFFVNHFDQRSPLRRNALHERRALSAFEQILAETEPHLVHVHHLAGHSLSLLPAPHRKGIPVVLQIQDWWLACARANLWHAAGYLCSGPAFAKCAACLPMTGKPAARLWSLALYAVRRALVARGLRHVDAAVCGSRAVAESLEELGVLPLPAPLWILPYGIEPPAGTDEASQRDPGDPIRFGVIGTLMPHKGTHVAVEAFRGLDPERVSLDLWGAATADPAYAEQLRARAAGEPIRFRGPFAAEAKARVLGEMDVLIVPSTGLESFGIVIREAHARGVPVIAADRGAPPEAIPAGAGALFEPESPSSLRALVLRIANDPDLVDGWRQRLPAVKPFSEHAQEIEAIYERLWRREP